MCRCAAAATQPYIIALTGHAEDKYVQRALSAGMNTLVAKPARVEDLVDLAKDLLPFPLSNT